MAKEQVIVAGGCFWCTEAVMKDVIGVSDVESGYIGGDKANPTYKEVCTGNTGHAEGVRVTFDSGEITLDEILDVFMGTHDPSQLNRQGNDVGTQYRSALYCSTPGQFELATRSLADYGARLEAAGYPPITTELRAEAPPFYYAEDEHQQYLHKHPGGYCGLGGTGVSCPVGAVL